jgi:serine/threonine-protein kinase
MVRRFRREVRAAARLAHPHVARVYHAGRARGTYYCALEYIDGIDLRRLVEQHGPLPVGLACELIRQAALGLQHVHDQGLVSRDVKPSNLLVTPPPGDWYAVAPGSSWGLLTPPPAPTIKIIDLGIARRSARATAGEPFTELTEAGVFVGTPDFASPEQAQDARRVDGRSDLYSLGATFYYLLTGRPPFPEGTAREKLAQHRLDKPAPVTSLRPDLPRAVSAIVYHLMAKHPEDRYQTPRELVAALARVRQPLYPPAPALS